ncbi:hypothetical protein BKA64DRAFT_476298 [Cadophora sp. MPI-SDFR-AT-0126]|nr:hypothetical protein BKA64DRAFT_476298 [Leotiomycetes sp. MPI-SDFR-AT-0126]
MSASRKLDYNTWNGYFLPGDGISREVISAEITRYLGNDALVQPGTSKDPSTGLKVHGYFITASRNLNSAMIGDLKAETLRWEAEQAFQMSGSSSSSFGRLHASSQTI